MTPGARAAFAGSYPGVYLVDPDNAAAIGRYLLERDLAAPTELPVRVERAGAGNMNLTLRVRLGARSVIVKQGRPWVEKYDHIPAPWERTLVEGAFYRTVQTVPEVAGAMPRLLHLDAEHHVLVLEDLGQGGDYTSIYADRRIADADLDPLLAWLGALSRVVPDPADCELLANRAMRALNHEHIFRFPLAADNGLDLDGITPGLRAAADALAQDARYCARVAALGDRYLAEGEALVHGDYFPGSWVRDAAGVRIIDPEFCFLGAREFDYGLMAAHLALARAPRGVSTLVADAARRAKLDEDLVLGFAGVEIMRRLIGVAQLPLPYGLDDKRRLLDASRALVLDPRGGLP